MGRVRDLVFRKLKEKDGVEQIFDIHHTLMKEYGWIPLEEFKRLPMQTVNNLLVRINNDRKRESKNMPKKTRKPRK